MHRRRGNALAGVPTQRVVDNQPNATSWHEVFHHQFGQHESDLVHQPATLREEPVETADVFTADCSGGPHTSVIVCRLRSSTQPPISIRKVSIEGAVKHGAKACRILANEITMAASMTVSFLDDVVW